MQRSESIAALAAALAKAQGEMGGAFKGKVNPHFKSLYADLAAVVDAIKGPLSANGISYVQVTEPSERQEVRVETILMHSSGEWISGITAVPVGKADAQGYGSALTYTRRYGLMAIVGIPAEDDDGNAAVANTPVKSTAQPDPALVYEAAKAIDGGMDSYRAFWQRITPAQREAIGAARHEQYKALAKEASEAAK